MRTSLKERHESNAPVAAIVIEPTQQSTGYVASSNFISTLHSIASDFEAALVVDETFSGCHASGNGHFFQYNGKADYVSFGQRTQAAGFFSRQDGIIPAGNENDVKLFKIIQQGISVGDLAKRSQETSAKLSSKASQLAAKI